jgi:CDP-glucose 4,6-dehydratase
MKYFITGHTGFKGTWLSLLLMERGHEVSGFSLEPEPGSLFEIAKVEKLISDNRYGDIRDRESIHKAIGEVSPNVVVHMAAQPLVRRSYQEPSYTYEVNVNGTLHVLEASTTQDVESTLIVTTDKVYKNNETKKRYVEEDPLGGHDPYSNSKAMADLLTQSWIETNRDSRIAIARAGNVIGGGDVSQDRLFPDLIRSYSANKVPKLRYPNAVRPWQHVLDCLNGYTKIIDKLLEGGGLGSWNIGPSEEAFNPVSRVADEVAKRWGSNQAWSMDEGENPPEASLLMLNPSKAQRELGWSDKYDFVHSVMITTDWYKDVLKGADPLQRTILDIREFEKSTG